jgi:hypothetical protein
MGGMLCGNLIPASVELTGNQFLRANRHGLGNRQCEKG